MSLISITQLLWNLRFRPYSIVPYTCTHLCLLLGLNMWRVSFKIINKIPCSGACMVHCTWQSLSFTVSIIQEHLSHRTALVYLRKISARSLDYLKHVSLISIHHKVATYFELTTKIFMAVISFSIIQTHVHFPSRRMVE